MREGLSRRGLNCRGGFCLNHGHISRIRGEVVQVCIAFLDAHPNLGPKAAAEACCEGNCSETHLRAKVNCKYNYRPVSHNGPSFDV
eukprot:5055885-Amphidinium_carterae.1